MSGEEAGPVAPLPGENWILEIPLADLEETEVFARELAAELKAGDLLVLTGGLGAGKTTFTQSLAEWLGVTGQVSSPTFVLSRIHRSADSGAATGADGDSHVVSGVPRPDLVHVDAYRTDADGFEALDLLSTMPTSITVVEWGRGLAEQALVDEDGSWLELELLVPEQQEPASGSEVPSSGQPPSRSADDSVITDFSESEEDILGAPRRLVLRGYGPRWRTPPAKLAELRRTR